MNNFEVIDFSVYCPESKEVMFLLTLSVVQR